MVKSGQAVTVMATTSHPTTGAVTDADSTPVGTLYVNGTANAATVTETKVATGTYSLAVTLPALSAGDVVSLGMAATVNAVAGAGIVWTDVADTQRVSEVGTAVATVDDLVDDLESRLSAARAGYLDKLNVSGTLAHSDAAATYKADVSGLALDSTVAKDATVMKAAGYTAPDNASITAILEDTGTTLPATLGTIAGYIDTEVAAALAAVDTEVAAIKAKTDNLPASPAVAGEAASAVATLNDFDPASDVVAHVTLVDTVTTLTEEIAASTDLTPVLEAIGDLHDFDPALDTVARVTLVDTVTTLTEELAASIDPADVQDAMTAQGYTAARAVKLDNLDTTVSSVGGAVIDDGVIITQATLGTDDTALGRVMPYGEIIVYRNGVAEWGPFQADADGDYSFDLPSGSVWTLKARANGYATTITEVSTVAEVS